MPIPGRLEVVLKINELPTEVTTDKNGWRHFVLDCNGVVVQVGMRPKNWTKIEKAASEWPQWVAVLGGQIQVISGDVVLSEATVQVFERRPKTEL